MVDTNRKPTIAAVVLAAGAASRFGRPKQLERWPGPDGPTLIERTLKNALACGANKIIVVTGNAAKQVTLICDEWAAQNFRIEDLPYKYLSVYNSRWQEGQGFSVAAGVKAAENVAEAIIFFLADQPRLLPSTGTALVEAFIQGRNHNAIIFPVFGGKRGNPVLFGKTHFLDLSKLEGDTGGRAVVKAHPEFVREVDVQDPAIHEDVDTQQDLSRLNSNNNNSN